ncbi:MAG: lysine--tRNA ligase [Cellvibrionales bacterium TMED49]|nr:lysine--tRNA ligase [Porticoccaceae bacterium]OUU39083.1 MAG: lysine--tRNA ligase [Cellvibrionales bacterium TMED49]
MTEERDENKFIVERRAKLKKLRSQTNTPFPNDFKPHALAAQLEKTYSVATKQDLEALQHQTSVAGRVMRNRGSFIVIQDRSGTIQLYVTKHSRAFVKNLDLGDIIGIEGCLHRSGRGNLYIEIETFTLLTKSLRPLPDKFHGLADREMRYRQRYLDLIVNSDVRSSFRTRSNIINYIRHFLNCENFLEVETPMLQPIPGGAAARPFVTHHNAMAIDMYLRIAPELYLKRLVVGGFERVYEINRSFRNEGLSTRHNPEFTMLEFYQAYADYNDLMQFTERLLGGIAREVLGSHRVINTKRDEYGNKVGEVEYDFSEPFRRLSVLDSILMFNPAIACDELLNLQLIRRVAADLGISVDGNWGVGKLQTEIFEKTVEQHLEQPTFVTHYPIEVSPLARRSDTNPSVTDRFELFIGGREVANGFSELNDPEEQADRFSAQLNEKNFSDEEMMYFDEDYIKALEYGMPPTAGEGIGIDRLVMLFTDSSSIRDVLLFPHMKPENCL